MINKPTFLIILTSSILIFIFTLFVKGTSNKTEINTPSVNVSTPKSRFDLSLFNDDIKVALAGDVMLGRTVMVKSIELGDTIYPFRKLASYLKGPDITFLNLEAPFVESCPADYTSMKFCADPVMIGGLVYSGVDVVNLANNHILNYGQAGLVQTEKLLSDKAIDWVGFGQLAQKKVRGVKFGFLGFDLVSGELNDLGLKLVADSKKMVDILIVGVHWGSEYQSSPSDKQKIDAKKLIESGADVIAGHHPHWVQGMEYIEGKPVFYSLGNLVFDQMWSEETKKGIVAELTIENKTISKIKIYETYIHDWGQPEMAR